MDPMHIYTIENRQTTLEDTLKEEQHCMNPLTLEWIEKAEEDYDMAANWLRQASQTHFTILSVSMRNSVLKNISRHGCKRRMFLCHGRTIFGNCWR